jgi:hypothetical protein
MEKREGIDGHPIVIYMIYNIKQLEAGTCPSPGRRGSVWIKDAAFQPLQNKLGRNYTPNCQLYIQYRKTILAQRRRAAENYQKRNLRR